MLLYTICSIVLRGLCNDEGNGATVHAILKLEIFTYFFVHPTYIP